MLGGCIRRYNRRVRCMEDNNMPIIGNPWAQDAGRFGQGVGDSLSQALLQLPQQRYMMALQQAQMAQRQQQMAQNYGLQQQRAQETSQYHTDELGLRKQALDQTGQYQNNELGIRQQQADNQWLANHNRMLAEVRANYLRTQLAQKPYAQDGVLFTPNTQSNVSQPSQGGLQQTNQPSTSSQLSWSASPIPQRPESPGQAMGNVNVAAGNYSRALNTPGVSNNVPLINILSNLLQHANSQVIGQPSMMQQSNQPGMMQSNNIPPWASQQLPDGSFNFAP